MDLSSVGAVSIQNHMEGTMQSVSIAMLRKVMQSEQSESALLLEQLEQAVPTAPPSDRLLDIHI
ncbi:MAG: putative motility protein [Provencibacterium sp.]|nr:putative motility protein [Provencibacterium sp.]